VAIDSAFATWHLDEKLLRLLGNYWEAQIGAAVVVAGMGYSAYRFKKWKQWWYGLVEIAFGFFSVFPPLHGLNGSHDLIARWATLVGCAYVISRGLNNTSEAKAKELEIKVQKTRVSRGDPLSSGIASQ
jgi:D-alanine-D-alanine ligase-like ATP-grasp enzyme